MTIYHVQLYKVLDNGEVDEKGCLMKDNNIPAVFLKSETAKDIGHLVITALNKQMYSRWGFRLVEGETL